MLINNWSLDLQGWSSSDTVVTAFLSRSCTILVVDQQQKGWYSKFCKPVQLSEKTTLTEKLVGTNVKDSWISCSLLWVVIVLELS